MSQHNSSTRQQQHDFSELEIIAISLSTETSDRLESTVSDVFYCFRKHCSVNAHYQDLKWNHRYVPAFKAAQHYLINLGLIKRDECAL